MEASGLPRSVVLLPVGDLALRDLEDVDVAALELGDGRARLGDDARLERVGLGRAAPSSAGFVREQQVVVVLPLDELPRSGADRMLAEVRRHVVRRDRRDGHREQLGEDRERLLERDDERGIVRARRGRRCSSPSRR